MKASPCWHCDQPIVGTPFRARTPDGEKPACCAGCAAAIETIHGLGLGDYYRFRGEQRPDKPDSALDTALAVFGISEITDAVIERNDAGCSIQLTLEGVHCAACVWLIEHALNEMPGITRASLNLATLSLRVSWRPDAITLTDIARRLMQLGYTPRLPVTNGQDDVRSQRMQMLRLLVAGLGAMQAMMYATALYIGTFDAGDDIYRFFFRIAGLLIATPVVFFSGWPFLRGAISALRARVLTMDVPVALALLLGWAGSIWATATAGNHVYFESIAMFVFFLLVSRQIEQRQRRRVSQHLDRLQSGMPLAVERIGADSERELVPVRLVVAGDHIALAQGDVIPVDGQICSGAGQLEEAMLTGEPLPRSIKANDSVQAGARLVEGDITLQVTRPADATMVAQIGELVARAQSERSAGALRLQGLASRFIGAVLVLALLTLWFHWPAGATSAFEHALAVLIVTCPCALALAAPLTSAALIGRALDDGLLVADINRVLSLNQVTDVVFDKTGTLTRGQFALESLRLLDDRLDREQVKALIAGLEVDARHPLAEPLRALATPAQISNRKQQQRGVSGDVAGVHWALGPDEGDGDSRASHLGLSRNGQVVARLALVDPCRDDAATLIKTLRAQGRVIHLCSGDGSGAVQDVAATLGIAQWHARQTPEDKRGYIEDLTRQHRHTLMIGDGVNDAPALLAAPVSIAMARGAALARQAGAAYLLHDNLQAISTLMTLARRARRTLRQNIGWALGYNLFAVPFAMAGLVPPWLAAIGMSASSLLVTLNAGRLSRWKS